MQDTLIINIPLQEAFCRTHDGKHFYTLEPQYFGLPAWGEFALDDETGVLKPKRLYHLFDKLPSSWGANVAIKFKHDNCINCLPYVSLNASPKLLQGHNVYYVDNLVQLVFEMLGLLKETYPNFFAVLDLSKAYVSRLDVTYFCRLPCDDLLIPTLHLLGTIRNGKRIPDDKHNNFEDTRYWNKATNRVGYCKIYVKLKELQNTIKSLERQAPNALNQKLLATYNQELQDFAKGLLRFEATTKKELLNQLNIPTNLWQFIIHCKKHPDTYKTLWDYWFNPIFQAISGEIMQHYDDSEIRALCREKLVTTTPTGKVSYTKAENAYKFYLLIKQKGFEHVKDITKNSTFYENVKVLCDIGIPKTLLQNLHNEQGQSIPLVKLIEFDFTNQVPKGYVPPKSQFDFSGYIRPQLQFVA